MLGVMTPDPPQSFRVVDNVFAGGVLAMGRMPQTVVVPNQPKTPQRTIRVPDELWDAAKSKAEAQDETVSDVIRRALERYVHEEGR